MEEAIESGSVGQSIAYEIVKMQESRPEFKHFCLKDDVVQHGKRNQLWSWKVLASIPFARNF